MPTLADILDRVLRQSVREASKDAALPAVAHHAEQVASRRHDGIDVDHELQAGFDRYTQQVQYWITRDTRVDPRSPG